MKWIENRKKIALAWVVVYCLSLLCQMAVLGAVTNVLSFVGLAAAIVILCIVQAFTGCLIFVLNHRKNKMSILIDVIALVVHIVVSPVVLFLTMFFEAESHNAGAFVIPMVVYGLFVLIPVIDIIMIIRNNRQADNVVERSV